MEYSSTLTSKGQVLIPLALRKKLNIKPKDRVIFFASKNGLKIRKAPSVDEMFGFAKSKKKLSDKDLEKAINKATEEGLTEKL
jgi:AbrB family looped-hinge helix DNA binding protein